MKKFAALALFAVALMFSASEAKACNPTVGLAVPTFGFTPGVTVATSGVVVNPAFVPTVFNVPTFTPTVVVNRVGVTRVRGRGGAVRVRVR